MPITEHMRSGWALSVNLSPKAAFWRWSIVGAVAATLLLFGQASALGGAAGILQVGETSRLRPVIESELGPVPVVADPGHDGQISYAIGLDLAGSRVGPLLDDSAYRYRRIFYPLVASLFGFLDGAALLVGLVVTTVISASLATGILAAAARRQGRSDWLALAVVLNPGVWLSVRLLTVDTLALALMLAGIYAVLTGSRWSIPAFALSGLSKDAYLVTSAGLAISRHKRNWLFLLVPVAVLASWTLWLVVSMGNLPSERGNISLPFVGLINGAENWSTLDLDGWFYLLFALVSVTAALVFAALRASWLRWSILGWGLLGLISSHLVWDFGNNAARVFAPIVVLLALSGREVRSARPMETGDGEPA